MNRGNQIVYRILDAFFRHRWMFLIAVVAVSGVTMTALYLRSKTYKADASIYIVPDDVASALGVSPYTNVWISPAQQNVSRFNDYISGDDVGGFLDLALKNANLDRPINVSRSADDPRYRQLRKGMFAYAASDNIMTIGLTWPSKDEAARIVSALRTKYVEEVGQRRGAQSVGTKSFLDQQIKEYEQRMRAAEKVLIDYKKRNSGQLPEAQTADIAQLSSLKAQMDNLRISAQDSALKRQALLQRIAQITPETEYERTIGESPTARAIKMLNVQRDVLLAGPYLPQHPRVQEVDAQIAALQKNLDKERKTNGSKGGDVIETKKRLNPEYQALQSQLTDADIAQKTQQAQMQSLQQKIGEYEARIQKAPAAQRDLTEKTRDYQVVSAQYENLLKQREDVNLKSELQRVQATSSLLTPGEPYAEPTTGDKKMAAMFVGSLVLGLIVGAIMVVLNEWADPSLRYEADVERLLGVPVLASVPDTAELRYLPAPPEDKQGGGKPALAAPAAQRRPQAPRPAVASAMNLAGTEAPEDAVDITLRLPARRAPASE